MKSAMRKSIRLGVAVGLVVTGLVGVTSLTSAGPATVDYGTLTLTLTDRAGLLTLVVRGDATTPPTTFTQALGVATPCSTLVAGPINPNPDNTLVNLLNFSAAVSGGSAPNVQLPSNGIGVADGANCGEPSGLVGPGETLTLDLGAFLPPDVTISDGTLQIGKSRGNDGSLRVAYDNGSFGTITVPVGVTGIAVTDADNSFRSISIRSTATQSSRGLSLRSTTVFNLVAPAPATAPGAPTAVTAVRGNTRATVSWVAPADDGGSPITGYDLQYSSNGGTTWTPDPPTTATSGQPVTGLTNGTPYIFRVRAVNTAGSSEWSQPSAPVTPATVPDAPTVVTAVRGNAQATVSWVASSSDGGSPITEYQLRNSSNGGTTWTTPTTATSPQTVTGLTNGTPYIFEVRAVNDVDPSGWSRSNAVTPATAPGLPTDVTAVSTNPAQATVSWVAPADGGSPITEYELRYSPNAAVPTWTPAPVDPATATTQLVTGLANGTAYIFEVRAVNDVDPGGWSRSNAATPWTELVDCGDDVVDDGETGEIAERATFLRGENGAKTEVCEDVGVVVEIVGNDWVYWDNSSVGVNGNLQAVQGTVTIDWAPIPVANADLPTEIDYDGPGTEAGFVDRLWCTTFSVQDDVVDGKRIVVFDAELPAYTGPGSVNGKAPWCLVSSSQSLDGDGNVNRTEIFFGAGDPLTRTLR
jgi:hypothetical protein